MELIRDADRDACGAVVREFHRTANDFITFGDGIDPRRGSATRVGARSVGLTARLPTSSPSVMELIRDVNRDVCVGGWSNREGGLELERVTGLEPATFSLGS